MVKIELPVSWPYRYQHYLMGQQISIPSQYHLRVPESLSEKEYTVIRTSGEVDQGWRIPLRWTDDSGRFSMEFPSASKHAQTERKPGYMCGEKKWRIFMWKEEAGGVAYDNRSYIYAWRRLDTIYPTELTDNEEAIEEWRKGVAVLLDELEAKRVAEGGMTPESEMKEVSLNSREAMLGMAQEDEERVAAYDKEIT